MSDRRPHPGVRTTTRPLRSDKTHARTPGAHASRQHARGERILRDGTVVRPRTPPLAPRRPRRRRGTLRMPLAAPHRRLHALLIVVAMMLSLCAGRLLQLQGFDSAAYAAGDAFTRTLPLLPARGEILDRNGVVLASSQPAVAVTADPTLTAPKAAQIAVVLSDYLGMTETELMPLLTKSGTRFVYLKKKVPALTYSALAADLAQRKIYGIFRESDPVRTYPNGAVGAPVVGFVGPNDTGQGGLEWSFNKELSGVEGKETYESAPNGSKIPLGQSSTEPAQNGLTITSTIDTELQWSADRLVSAAVRRTDADSGIAIVINVKTGEILAMSVAPTFDPAKYSKSPDADRGNRALSEPYEPGSVEKILTSAALIDAGVATPETKVEVPGRLPSGGAFIKDHFPHETLHYTMRGVIANSSNIGTALLTRQIPKDKLYNYLTSFGLGSRTGIELPGESAGIMPPRKMSDGTRDQIAFGQAISVTAIQQISALAGIVNHGIYNPPTVIKSVTDAAGNPVDSDTREPRRIITEKSSAQVRDLMQAVVDSPNGVANLALKNYQSGGKTGTAERAAGGVYDGYVTSYVGFAPLDDPKLMTYVVINNPHKGDTGTSTAAPVYRDIMNQALPRYSVEPDAKKHEPKPTTYGKDR